MEVEISRRLHEFERKIIVAQILGLLIFIGMSIIFNSFTKEQLAITVGSFINRTASMGDLRETILNIEDARQNHFAEISLFLNGKSVTVVPNPIFNQKGNPFVNSFLFDIVKVPLVFGNSEIGNSIGEVHFKYSRLDLAPYAFSLWLILVLLSVFVYSKSKNKLLEKIKTQLQQESESQRGNLAKDVIHDLRSPLNSLQSLAFAIKSLNVNEKNLLVSTIENVRGIISRLDLEGPITSSQKSYFLIEDVIHNIIEAQTKTVPSRIQLKLHTHGEFKNIFLFMNLSQFQSMAQNIIENATQAISGHGEINISLFETSKNIELLISDTGCGIANQNLDSIFKRGWTFGKKGGSGLGLYQVQNIISASNGSVDVHSQLGAGTRIKVTLPKSVPPSWWVKQIEIPARSFVVLVDDQESQGHLWQLKLESMGFDVQKRFQYFSSAEAFKNYWLKLAELEKQNFCLLFDYDLGKSQSTGLDLIHELKLYNHSMLVTGHFDDQRIMNFCDSHGVPVLAKSTVASIPILLGA